MPNIPEQGSRTALRRNVNGQARALGARLAQGVAVAALSASAGGGAFAQCAPSPTGANPAQVVCSGTVPAGGAQFTTGAFTGNLDVKATGTAALATGVALTVTDGGTATFTSITGATITNASGAGVGIATTTGTATLAIGSNISGSTAGVAIATGAGATSVSGIGTITATAVGGVGIQAATVTGNVAIGGSGVVLGGAGILVTAAATTPGGIDSGSVSILRGGSVTGNAVVANPATPYLGSQGDGIHVVTNGGSIEIGTMSSVAGTANAIWARTGGTGNETQILNAGTIRIHDIGTLGSAGGLDSALRGWGGGGVTVENIGTITGGLDGIHMTAIGTPITSYFLAQNITSITAERRSAVQATATGDLTARNIGAVTAVVDGIVLSSLTSQQVGEPAGNILVDTVGPVTTANTAAGGTGLLLSAQHGAITVRDVAGIDARLDGVNASASGGIAVTATRAAITSRTASGLLLNAGTGVSVQSNQAITGATDGVSTTTTSGNIDISLNKLVTGQTGSGIYANASAGNVTIADNAGIVGGQNAIIALGAGAIVIDRNAAISSSSDIATYASGATVAYTNNGATAGGKDGVALSGATSVTASGNGAFTAANGVALIVNATGGDATVSANGPMTGTSAGLSAGGAGAVRITGNGNITGAAGDGINAYNLTGGTPSITIDANADIHGNTNGINAGTAGSVTISGNGKIDGHDGVGMTVNAGGAVTLQNNAVISGNTEGAYVSAGGNVLVSGNRNIYGGTLNAISVVTPGTVTFTGNGPILGNISGINIQAGSNIAVTSVDSIIGLTASGILATSTAGAIAIDHSIGSIVGANAGISTNATAAGAATTVTNQVSGYIQARTALDVTSGSGTVSITNQGTLRGLELGLLGRSGNGAFNVVNGGTIDGGIDVTGAKVATSTFTNAGTVRLGSRLSRFSGNFTQTAAGTLAVDTDLANGQSGRLDVAGKATLAGTLVVNPLNIASAGGLTRQFTVLHAGGGITNNGLTAANTAAVTYALLYPNANDLVVSATVNFQGATQNQASVGGALNTFVAGGGSSPLTNALMQVPTATALGSSLDQLQPAGTQQSPQNIQFVSGFNNALLSCATNGEGVALGAEGQCVWVRARALRTSVEATASRAGVKDHTEQIMAGVQVKVAEHWRAGIALGYDQSATTSLNAHTTGDRVSTGGVLKYTNGPWLLAATVSGGWGGYDTARQIAFAGFSSVATSSADSDFLAGRLHAAYLADFGSFYLKPLVDGGLTRIARDGYSERGGGGAALDVAGVTTDTWSISPALQLGTQLHDGDYAWRPFVKAGATFLDASDTTVTSSFVDAPAAGFVTTARYDRVLFDVGAGIDLLNVAGAALRVQYDGKFGATTQQHNFAIKGSMPF
ncbi:MAG: autotransporter domain-containing protein [Hyphomicrobiaceae bacterium]